DDVVGWAKRSVPTLASVPPEVGKALARLCPPYEITLSFPAPRSPAHGRSARRASWDGRGLASRGIPRQRHRACVSALPIQGPATAQASAGRPAAIAAPGSAAARPP